MPIDILMPALSPTMEEGKLAKWLVKVGDEVTSGDVLAEIETDKATMEVEAIDEGIVGKLLVPEGSESVKVNAVIAVLFDVGESPDDLPSADHLNAAPIATPQPVELKDAEPERPSSGNLLTLPLLGNNGKRIFSSPLARRIATQKGIDLAQISGSGPHGRIIKRDVEAAAKSDELTLKASANAPSTIKAEPRTGLSDDLVLQMFEEGSYDIIPHDGMRKTIASRLTQSSQTIPAYFLSVDCELDAILSLRKQLNDGAPLVDNQPVFKLSVNDFIIKALALALRDNPSTNASWTESGMVLHKHVDIGVAVAIDGGLITPIIRAAEDKTLSMISNEVKDLAMRARERKLKPVEYQGGTTAVSNLGMFGVRDFTSIINPPHASIVSIGAGEQRAVVKQDALSIATMMTTTFAFDHRVIDGAIGATLAARFKYYLQNPLAMLV